MNKERREKAIAWIVDEIRSLELAPELNGCPMTPEWAEQLEIMRTCLEAVQDHFCDSTKMMPLTLEQLREMDGWPVWVVASDEKTYQDVTGWCVCSLDGVEVPGVESFKWPLGAYGNTWTAYAYPPAHIDREWDPCGECAPNCSWCKHYQEITKTIPDVCRECKHYNNYEPEYKYCCECGRPLTEEAWAELEKRMRG